MAICHHKRIGRQKAYCRGMATGIWLFLKPNAVVIRNPVEPKTLVYCLR
jgi:hypothetical protein